MCKTGEVCLDLLLLGGRQINCFNFCCQIVHVEIKGKLSKAIEGEYTKVQDNSKFENRKDRRKFNSSKRIEKKLWRIFPHCEC